MDSTKEDKFTILLIADNFDPHFAPITHGTSWAKWHLASIPLLDLALNWISLINSPNVPNIMIASATLTKDELAEFQTRWAYNFKSFSVVHCKDCMSVGQIIREIDSRGLTPKGEFLLIDNLATFCSSNLLPQIESFRNRRKKEKDCIMSILYSRQISGEPRSVGFEENSKRMLLYQGHNETATPEFGTKMFVKECTMRTDLAPCGIVLCSPEVVLQFTDNFDFDIFDQVVRELLVNEEVICKYINVEILPEDVVAFTTNDYGSLLRAQRLLVHRWCYPLTYDKLPARIFGEQIPLRYHRNHVYVPRNEEPPLYSEGTVLGQGCTIADSASLLDVTLGNDAVVGKETTLKSVIAGRSFKIGSGSSVIGAVIGDNVTIGNNCRINSKTVVGSGVVIPNNVMISSNSAVMAFPAPADDDDIESSACNGYYLWRLTDEPNGYFWRRSQSFSRVRRERHMSTHSRSSLQHSLSMDRVATPMNQPDEIRGDVILDTEYFYKVFLNEIKDSMRATFDSENRTLEAEVRKLILEINSSKLANNISGDDVTKGVFTTFLQMPPFATNDVGSMKGLFNEWMILWENYYRTETHMMQLLSALEDAALESDHMRKLMPHVVNFIYDNLDNFDEEVIVPWYQGLPGDSGIRTVMAGFVEWLEAEESESGSESDG